MTARVPFDSFTLSAVIEECRALVGARVQHIVQPSPLDIVLELYGPGKRDAALLISADAQFARTHLVSRRSRGHGEPPAFCMTLRKRLDGAHIRAIVQSNFDRVMHVQLNARDGSDYVLIAELMGKHSNIVLVAEGMVVGAIKHVGSKLSRVREILPGKPYVPPPPAPGIGPFLTRELELRGLSNPPAGPFQPTLIRGEAGRPIGAYPMTLLQAPADRQFPRTSLSETLEFVFSDLAARATVDRLYTSLKSAVTKALRSREHALRELERAVEESAGADRLQLFGDLILTYATDIRDGAAYLEAPDYTQPDEPIVTIPLDPEKPPAQNADDYYRRARKAKDASEERKTRRAELTDEHVELQHALSRLESAGNDLSKLNDLNQELAERRWLHTQKTPDGKPAPPPFEGHRIRNHRADGYEILYGENATSNDYLTLRVAKPNDWWLHVRAATGAHVVIRTANKPERVPKKVIEEAAHIAAKNSGAKHSGVVPVDYTLRKYVRKPKGAAPGAALYSHEKTIHVTSADTRPRR